MNSGAFDPLGPIGEATRARGAWLHVDGAFGLWAAVSPSLRHLVFGIELADSVATDAHKWLNVPYDSGLAFVADRAAHRAAMSLQAAYLPDATDDQRNGFDWVPEQSRRARGFPVYAAIRSLGRTGVADLVERSCALARRFARRLGAEPGIRILNDVVLNQVLVRFDADGPADASVGDELTGQVIAAVQADGTCWAGATMWHGQAAMRISVSSWMTTEADVDRSGEAIIRCARATRG